MTDCGRCRDDENCPPGGCMYQVESSMKATNKWYPDFEASAGCPACGVEPLAFHEASCMYAINKQAAEDAALPEGAKRPTPPSSPEELVRALEKIGARASNPGSGSLEKEDTIADILRITATTLSNYRKEGKA